MKIEKRPWIPQDLIDDLQSLIDEEPKNYLNTRYSTLCMARDYLKEYFLSQQNAPLTLKELREMDGMPVWISPVMDGSKIPERWMLMAGFGAEDRVYLFMPAGGMVQTYSERTYRKTWLAYRCKPLEGTP